MTLTKKRHPVRALICIILYVMACVPTYGALATHDQVRADDRSRTASQVGLSVDTATGAYLKQIKLASVHSYVNLDFDLFYNSLLVDLPRNGVEHVGYGWTHQYEGRIDEKGDIVTVALNKNVAIQFQFAGEGMPYTPLNQQNRYDILEKITQGDLAGLWRLKRLDGTTYLFDSFYGQLRIIQNRNRLPIIIEYFGSGDPRISNVTAGERSIKFYYDGDLKIQAIEHGDEHTFLDHDSRGRLSRIYDAVGIEELASRTDELTIAEGNAFTEYPLIVTKTESGHIFRLQHSISHSKPWQLQKLLRSPSGQTITIDGGVTDGTEPEVSRKGEGVSYLNQFVTENPAGSWTLLVRDSYVDGVVGVIKEARLEWSESKANFVQYYYDTQDRVTIAYHKDKLVSFTKYDSNGRVRLQAGGGLHYTPWKFEYLELGGNSLRTTVTDREGGISQYTHDGNFNLTSFEDSLGNKSYSIYDPITGNRTAVIDPQGNETSFTYYDSGHLKSVTLPNGATTAFQYDEFDLAILDEVPAYEDYDLLLKRVDSVFDLPDELSSTVILAFVDNKIRIQIYDADGKRVVSRSEEEFITGNIIPLGSQLNTELTLLNPDFPYVETPERKEQFMGLISSALPVSLSPGERGNLTSVTDEQGNKSTFKYNEYNRIDEVVNAAEQIQQRRYDGEGNLGTLFNKEGNGVEFSYVSGQVVKATVLLEEDEAGDPEEIVYDASGRIVKMTDASGSVIETTYDEKGNVIENRNALGHAIVMAYDEKSQLVSRSDMEGNTSHFEYDQSGNLVRATNPLGESRLLEYDRENRLVKVTDAAGNSTKTEYDSAGRVRASTNALGIETTYEYDALGNQTAVFRDGIKLGESIYNDLSLPISRTDSLGNTTVFEYDELGQLVATTSPSGKRTEMTYNSLGHLVEVSDPLGRKTQKSYFDDDTVKGLVDAGSNENTFTYTTKNNVKTVTTPGGAVTTLDYTGNDFVSLYVPPSGNKAQRYIYDKANRLVRTSFVDAGTPDIVNVYDKNGNKLSVSTQLNDGALETKITRSYDALDRRVSITDAAGNVTTYEYNNINRVSKITYPNTNTVSYTYDPLKRLKTITDWANRVTTYKWNSFDQVESIQFPNGASSVMTYSDTGRLIKRFDYDAQGAVIVGLDFNYDQNGFVTSEQVFPEPTPYVPSTSNFVYGDDNRLVEKDGLALSYDPDGNVTQGPVSGNSSTLGWDINNRLASYDNPATTGEETTYHYDVEDNLVGWESAGGDSVEFAVVDSSTGSRVMISETSAGNETVYVYGIGLVYEVTDGEVKVHHYDVRGNTIAHSNPSGELSGRIAYSPYGEIIDQSGDYDTLFKFTGFLGVITAENDLNYMRFRWYSPEMKRFVSMDSRVGNVASGISMNRYAYAAGNPINFADPDGEIPVIVVGILIGIAIGAGVEAGSQLSDGKDLDELDWGRILIAAGAGGVAGGLAAIPGAYPAYAGSVGWTALAAAGGGFVGTVAENALLDAFNKEEVDWEGEVWIEAGIAGTLSGLTAGTSKYFTKIKLGKLGRTAFSGIDDFNRLASKGEKILRRTEIASQIVDAALAVGINNLDAGKRILGRPLDDQEPPPPQAQQAPVPPNSAGQRIGKLSIDTAGAIGQGGGFQHYQAYIQALGIAGRPVPNPPATIPTF